MIIIHAEATEEDCAYADSPSWTMAGLALKADCAANG